jgi:hypothetical protein
VRPVAVRVARLLVAATAAAGSIGGARGQSPSAASVFDYPRRAPGLWEVRSVGAQAAGLPPTQQCIGAASDTAELHLDRSAGKRGACEFGPYRRSGKGWLAESVCRHGRNRVTSRSLLTGDLSSAYRIDTVVRYEPPLGGRKHEDRDALEARRLGPCLAGQAPGDTMIPGMGTLNMVDGEFRGDPKQSSSR